MTTRQISIRLFLTCWVVYGLHFATDFVREHYLVVSIAEQGTFRLDQYHGLHPDIFRLPDGHAYHGANPGISMLATIPYFLLRPVADLIVRRELSARGVDSDTTSGYEDRRPARVRFYKEVRRRGLDVKFGLVGLITMVFCMAPLTALSVVVMFRVLGGTGLSNRVALGGAFLYAFGTPIFFRTAFLNQNLAVGVFGFLAFALLWDAGRRSRFSVQVRYMVAGFLGGLALLCDYSGGMMLALCGLYAVARARDKASWPVAFRTSAWYILGAIGPILVLWFYQWAAFGTPFYPPQHHMPPVEWSDLGYQGVTKPNQDLFWVLLLDSRFGLFVTAPILVLALFAPWLNAKKMSIVPWRETAFVFAIAAAFILFFSGVQYTQLQYITGIRYLVPIIPFLFLLTAAVLVHLPRVVTYFVAFIGIAMNWAFAMARPHEQDVSVFGSIKRVLVEGLQLPALSTLSKMAPHYVPDIVIVSPLPLFVFTAVVIFLIWRIASPTAGQGSDGQLS
jgi:MFS family permease